MIFPLNFMLQHISHVGFHGIPTEIAEVVVVFEPVVMTDLRTFKGRTTNECQRDKARCLDPIVPTILGKAKSLATASMHALCGQIPCAVTNLAVL